MGGRRHGLRCVTAPALDFGILTETKDSETATVESSFTVTSAYTAEDFVSDTRSAFLACVTEDLGGLVFLFDLVFYNFFWIHIIACKKAIFKKLDL